MKDMMRSENPNRDWEEDFSHENGNYQCICMKCENTFFGHKRRVLCKICPGDNLSNLIAKREIAISQGASKQTIADFDFAIELIKEYRQSKLDNPCNQ